MKVVAKIPVGRFRCKPGRVKAEGKSASPTFCYRVRVQKKLERDPNRSVIDGRVSVVELHSTVTGRKIGYIGPPSVFLVKEKGKAERWVEMQLDRALKPFDTPEEVQRKVETFIDVAQDWKHKIRGINPQFRRKAVEAWKLILREAKK